MGPISRLWGVAVALWAGGAVAAEAPAPSRLAAVVAGKPITALDVAQRLRLSNINPRKATSDEWKMALTAEVDRAVLLAAAQRENIAVSGAEVDEAVEARRTGPGAEDYERRARIMSLDRQQERKRAREQLMIRKLLSQKLGSKLFVSTAAVAEWYEKNKDLLASPEVRVARVITVLVGSTEDSAAARKKVSTLRKRVLDGADFAALARGHSDDPWAEKGGLLEPMQEGMSGCIFAEHVFSIEKPGVVTEPFETKIGVHILKLEEIRPSVIPNFKEVQEPVRRRLLEQLRAKHVQELVRQLRQKTAVKVFWENVLPAAE